MIPTNQFDKKLADGPFQKYHEAFGFFKHLRSTSISSVLQSSFSCFACLLFVGFAVYQCLGGHILSAGFRTYARWFSGITEPLGLLVLRRKVETQNSVVGISGMTMQMYLAVYSVRCYVNMPAFKLANLDVWAEQVMGYVSLLLVLDILRSVFWTHRSTYQESLDVVKAKYLISGALVMALVLRPHFHFWSFNDGFWWCFCLYLDVVALMPQIFMMAHGGGVVKAPIAHFVAAVFVSRVEDAWDLRFAPIWEDEWVSLLAVVALHMLHLLMIADFMYYYVKAHFAGGKLADDLKLGMDII